MANPDINGTAKFIKNADNSTSICRKHPAHIHFNTAAESGDVALTLGAVNGGTGFSTITTSTLNDNSKITYEELFGFDAYINVHLSNNNLGTLVAQGDIEENELTGKSTKYPLASNLIRQFQETLLLKSV